MYIYERSYRGWKMKGENGKIKDEVLKNCKERLKNIRKKP